MTWLWLGVIVAAVLIIANLVVRRSVRVQDGELAKFHIGDITLETLVSYCGYDFAKPILVAVKGKVYDVTQASSQFGPGGPLHAYAGREISRALAKDVVSVDALDDKTLHDLNEEETGRLESAVADFDRQYDMVGQVVPLKELKLEELKQFEGSNPSKPLYLSIKGTIFDVSKGSQFYGPNGVYPFAGRECARALALMSTKEEDCNGSIDDLGYTELDILRDWEAKFRVKYPIVGHIVDSK